MSTDNSNSRIVNVTAVSVGVIRWMDDGYVGNSMDKRFMPLISSDDLFITLDVSPVGFQEGNRLTITLLFQSVSDNYSYGFTMIRWSDADLTPPSPPLDGNRSVAAQEQYQDSLDNWPPHKTVVIKLPYDDVAIQEFVKYVTSHLDSEARVLRPGDYMLTDLNSQCSTVSINGLNDAFHKYIKVSVDLDNSYGVVDK